MSRFSAKLFGTAMEGIKKCKAVESGDTQSG